MPSNGPELNSQFTVRALKGGEEEENEIQGTSPQIEKEEEEEEIFYRAGVCTTIRYAYSVIFSPFSRLCS